ncbi:sensor histidine kinase [Actinoplanes regularis]|uniref:sensor histidine kinase n=1 Tax=Actinoplanes regularis TaxID=52697 RepID=UPI0024A22A2A|nr:sensor histidine kinase [Actinoplanes regularis]GLW34264.1 histidine kinase [Actinoplanes regularis]
MTTGRAAAPVTALWSPLAWRATFHVLAGMFLSATTVATIWLLGLLWWAAMVSLVEGPTGDRLLAVLYLFLAVLGPLALLPFVRFLSALQRERFRVLLGVRIAAPRAAAGTGRLRLPRAAGPVGRQLGYHLLAPLLGGVGGMLVVLCWSAPLLAALPGDHRSGPQAVSWFGGAAVLLLAAPWVARGIAAADTAVARRLLGPSPSDELAERVESLARSRTELVRAADDERRRIERDLHDGVQQRLVSLAMNLGMARAAGPDQATETLSEVIAAAHDEATAALAELRDFIRGLHPAVLNDRGLDAALSGIAARAPLPVRLRVAVVPRCSPSIEAIAYFAVSEALTNVAKHAGASRAEVAAERTEDRLIITVTDDGRGGASADGAGTGLRGLAQRAAAVDGTLTVLSPPGGPTTVTVDLPCE